MREDIFNEDGSLSLKKIFGKGYDNGLFFNCKVRYRVFEGSRSSKKSTNIIGYEPIFKILDNDLRNILMLRQNDTDNRQSTYEELIKCIIDLGMENAFDWTVNPLTITYIKTGQKIIFRGMNNPTGLNSVTFSHGFLTDIYIEEAFEIKSYADFRKLDGSLRGKLPKGLFLQITLCLNGWDGKCWIYEEFFKNRLEDDYEKLDRDDVTYLDYEDEDYIGAFGKGIYLHKSTYKINEFRDPIYDLSAKKMKEKAPEIYKVEFLGMFGNSTSAVYPEWHDSLIMPVNDILKNYEFIDFAIGIDTGLSSGDGKAKTVLKDENVDKKIRAATAMELCAITNDFNKLIVIDEYYHTNDAVGFENNTDCQKSLNINEQVMALLDYIVNWQKKYSGKGNILMQGTINVYIDSGDIGFRQILESKAREYGLYNLIFMPSTKTKILGRIDFDRSLMADDNLIVSQNCHNLIREYKNSRRGKKGEPRENINDHCLNSKEYASAPMLPSLRRYKTFKDH